MEALEKRRIKKQGILVATGGLVFALTVCLGLRAMGLTHFRLRDWWLGLGLTLSVQAVLWLVPHLGWDERLRWDPHFLYVPMVAAAVLLNSYIALVPEARYLILFVWFVAILFMAGLAGFLEVVLLSTVMTAGYLAVLNGMIARGEPVSLRFEHTFAASFYLTSMYAGVVFERLRRERREMKGLRRRLDEMAHTDPLTALPNRRQFEAALQAELATLRRYGGHCAVAMIDVDYFKHYNDAHGHPAGDELLRSLADLMRTQVRGSDVLARYGGEEFGLIMNRTSRAEAHHTVERLRAVVESFPFARTAASQPGGRLTISAGIAAAPEDGAEYDVVVRRADEALYTAKRTGRNRVVTASAATGAA